MGPSLASRAGAAQELLTYLLLNRERPVARELLSETLWPDQQADTRKTLRQVLWQVQSALARVGMSALVTDDGFVGLPPDADIDPAGPPSRPDGTYFPPGFIPRTPTSNEGIR